MEDLSLHILDIAENSIAAGAKNIEIKILEDTRKDILRIEIIDDGKGMTPEEVKKVTDPFFTSRTTRRVGLGLPFFNQAAKMANGSMTIDSVPGKGTYVSTIFQSSHIDRQPLGSMAETIVALIAGNPEIEIKYIHERNGNKFNFETKEIKQHLKDININSTDVLIFIKNYINENMKNFPTQISK
ncbi:MAG: ATP-binding protein [Bacteroidota bacterium]|nr:ATP-binding protein [Bacteroidota bacterium]